MTAAAFRSFLGCRYIPPGENDRREYRGSVESCWGLHCPGLPRCRKKIHLSDSHQLMPYIFRDQASGRVMISIFARQLSTTRGMEEDQVK